MDLTNIITLLGMAGGMQGIVETVKWWHSRKIRHREEDAAVSAVEYENVRKQTDWLESRLADRDAKIDLIYAELRKEQALRIGEIFQRHEVELRLTEAEARKCLVKECSLREPPHDAN